VVTKPGRPVFPFAAGVVKALSIVVGGLLTVISLMSVVGVVAANGFVRLGAAALVALAAPALVIDRLLPKKDVTKAPGLATDVYALALLGFAFVFCGVAQPLTKGMLVREGDRLAAAGFAATARVAYLFGGVSPDFPGEDAAARHSGPAKPAPSDADAAPLPSSR
jgi:hypothetical protein